ncbi:hypothetical protein AVEN_203420-1 [Araneus ventricosus]|uniref:Uncharacterized protein n=1 Tax=Araneus ventricosus TaxID=182803 RepID=A0A4Y2F1Q2_ARAVE|nr:hypothetical protein AVEN_90833-1 [Araneus ventricosus]GBM35584.1 hypothetical protein AVEN_203420-1 [Araneus ventricosus]
MQTVQKLPQRVVFTAEMLSRIENEHDFLNQIIFSDEATFHVDNKVNISTTLEFGAQKIPMQYSLLREPVTTFMANKEFTALQGNHCHLAGGQIPSVLSVVPLSVSSTQKPLYLSFLGDPTTLAVERR